MKKLSNSLGDQVFDGLERKRGVFEQMYLLGAGICE